MTNCTPNQTVRRAARADHGMVRAILTEAFEHDPVACWLFPAPEQRAHLQAAVYFQPLLAHPAADADLIGDGEGASVWLTLAAGQPPYGATASAPNVAAAGIERLQALGEALSVRHPDDAPHLYLPCMGVATARRGTGLGSAMLRHRLDHADARGLGAYLEASSTRSRALYLRHGFEDHSAPVQVAGSPPLWPMWRAPRKPTETGEH